MPSPLSSGKQLIWQVLFIVLGTSWLLAPNLNEFLSNRTSLISQYESSGQPYSLLFRLCDILAAACLIWIALSYYRHRSNRNLPVLLLFVIGLGMLIDPIFTVSCQINVPVCREAFSLEFLVHAVESCVTALALVLLAIYDAKVRHRLVSLAFVVFQVGYGILALTQYADQGQFNTASQYVYQYISIIWLAWFVRDFLFIAKPPRHMYRWTKLIRYSVAAWALINGLFAIILSLTDINLFGRAQNLYFAHNTAWLAQHGVIVGVIMLYLSRHILRGERRARQILLVIIGVEVLKYAVITPSWPLVILYSIGFCLLFVLVDDFRRGALPLTWRLRVKDLVYMVMVLLAASLLALIVLDRDSRVSRIADHSFRHFSYYAVHSDGIHRTHKESVLLAHTITAFTVVSAGTVLWILFKPYKLPLQNQGDLSLARDTLEHYSHSSEDYFKLWPTDKQYFWNKTKTGFIAYKIVGSVAFALSDPTCNSDNISNLLQQFIEWSRERRLRVCFLVIMEPNLKLYDELTSIQIGASALVNCEVFLNNTIKEKWWRWKQNRAIKQGYKYAVSHPPHSTDFLNDLKLISDDWLHSSNHQERSFALGYFERHYLQDCTIHYLQDRDNKAIAFANQLPVFNKQTTATIDLMRYRVSAADAMPYLLFNIIQSVHAEGYRNFDLGFVPFAKTKGILQGFAKAISSSRFSAKGLQQFKNKFKPEWQKTYMAYDGDIGDLAAIARNIEAAMAITENKNTTLNL